MVAKVEDLERLPAWPRLLSRDQAAAYLGTSPTLFDTAVANCIWPKPLEFNRRRLWDRHALDRAVDAMSSILPLDTEQILARALERHRKEKEEYSDMIMEITKKMGGSGPTKSRRKSGGRSGSS